MALAEKQVNGKAFKKATGKAAPMDMDDIFAAGDKENVPAASKQGGKSVEETYQKLTQLEHVLLRPDTYIGSTEQNRSKLWVFDEGIGLNQREVSYVPGLYKIFDEILVNAADNKQRDKSMDTMKVNIDPQANTISVYNNGQGIPVEMHKEEKCWVPELIFGHLLTSSNYNDNEKKTTGGRNGYGAKLANIFSTEFTVETADGARSGKKFKQTFSDNMQTKGSPKVKDCGEGENWTCITFKPDLSKFKMTHLDADIVALMKKRVHDMAGCTPGVKVFLQGERIKVKNFEEYCNLYLAGAARDTETGTPAQYVHLRANDRWEVCVAVSEGQFQQVSFVNSIATTRGGTHVNYIMDQIAHLFMEYLGKKHKGLKLKPFQIKNHIWVFINTLIENPAFDSQTKETLTLKPSAFGSKVDLDDAFFKKLLKGTGVLDSILSFGQEKQEKDMKKTDGKRTGRITGIPKLEDANDAGTKNADHCTLILTEGDSAKALAVSGLAVVGRDRYGVFPLRGKVANPRDANHEQIMKNEEIKNLKLILGLQQGNKYENGPTGLRYGHVMIMADQDPDGSHIKGLLINLFHYYWPNLLRHPGFLQEFATPIVKAKKKSGKDEVSFFTLQEYEEWRKQELASLGSWTIKYYKGLGTSSSQEAKEYFSNLPLHQMNFAWEGAEDGEIIEMVFSKKRADDRKQWLLKYKDDVFVDHNSSEVSYSEFVNKELIHFSMMDNTRSIPSIVDGLKPGQRKILFACFKRKLVKEVKVAQLAGYVAEHSAYHHGEQSLAMAIINMAQNFVGSNNINLLVPSGQFGTRLQGGADAASPRYIFTLLNAITRMIFDESDDAILKYLDDDGQSIEPQWYVPILPTILVNGGHGIGTGWSTDVPTYNPRDIVANIKRLIAGEVMEPMHPWFRNFKGAVDLQVSKKGEVSYTISGIYNKVNETTLEILELPVGKWTQQYKEFLEELMDTDGGKKEPFIKGYKEYHTDTVVHFEVQMSEKSMQEAEEVGIAKKFQLCRNLSTTNMHLFNAEGQITKYASPEEILQEFYTLRLVKYEERKAHMVGELRRNLAVLDNKVRFIREVIAGTLVVSNRKKADVVADLVKKGYQPNVKEHHKKKPGAEDESEENEAEQAPAAGAANFDYLLNMAIMSLTLERVQALQADRDAKATDLDILLAKSPAQLWEEDLERFVEEYDAYEEAEARRAVEGASKKGKGKGGKAAAGGKKKAAKKRKTSWGGSDDESDDSVNDDDDDEFVPKKAGPVKRPAPAAPKPAAAAPAKPSAFAAAAAPAAKKQDAKLTPDKTKMKAAQPVVVVDDDDALSLSLFDRLNQKASAPAKPAAAKAPAKAAAAAAAKPKPKGKKKKVDSEDEDDNSDFEANDSDEEFEPAPKKKASAAAPAASSKAAKPVKAKAKKDEDVDLDDAIRALQGVEEDVPAREVKPRRAAAAKKPIIESSDEEDISESDQDEDDDFGFEAKKPAAAKPKAEPKKAAAAPAPAARKKKVIESSDEEEAVPSEEDASDDDFSPKKNKPAAARKPTYANKPKKAPAPAPPAEDEDEEESYAPAPVKPAAKKPAAAAKPAAAPKPAAAAVKAAKPAAVPKKKKKAADSDEDSDEFDPSAVKAAAGKKKKGRAGSDSDDSDGVVAPAPAAGARPARRAASKPVKYQLDDDSSEVSLMDEDSDFDD